MKTSIKIAAVTDDGVTISPHFRRARYYEVLTIEPSQSGSAEKERAMAHLRGRKSLIITKVSTGKTTSDNTP
jgi:predicted Fe-Mo cluster-binding NifX family protein